MARLELVSDERLWKNILHELEVTDIYYQYEYVKSMAVHLCARPILVNYVSEGGGLVYSLLIRDIASDLKFKELISKNTYYDSETPYGYGGPIFYGDFREILLEKEKCRNEIRDGLNEIGIITQFIRFNPLLFDEKTSTVIVEEYGTYKNTVFIDLLNEETIFSNMDSQYRRKVRKAKEAGVIIRHDNGEDINEFIRLYNMTMKKHNAEEMYFFEKSYYQFLISEFGKNLEVFYAVYNDRVIGASIFLHDKKYMHFHLGGRDINGPNIPFENLLMIEAAIWGMKNGMKKLHIGGGLSDGDSLYQYKVKYNRSGIIPFFIGRSVFDKEKYDYLMRVRLQADNTFDSRNKYYIQYRF